jgi:hypothetical protein
METDKLIGALAADAARPVMPMRIAWLLALALGTVLAAIVFMALAGPRPDFAQAAETLRFPFKFLVTLALFATAMQALTALARPGMPAASRLPLLLCAPALLALAVLAEIVAVPADELATRTIGSNAVVCLTFIPLIGLGPLAALLLALRRGAPTRPVLAGIVAGLAAGGLAATFYAAHCTDDSPLFVAVWYSLAIAILAAAGGLLGRWAGRW